MQDISHIVRRRAALEDQIAHLGELIPVEVAEDPDHDVADLQFVLDAMIDDLRALIAVKSRSGYFEDILEAAPHQEHTISTLRSDHDQLVHDLQEYRTAVEAPGGKRRTARQIRGWLKRFRELDHRETQLLQDALNLDLGGLD